MKNFFLIDYSSYDNYGSYVDEILKASAEINQIKAFTHVNYKYDRKNVYPIFDFISSKLPFNFIKKFSKYCELWISFCICIIYLYFFESGKKLVMISLYQSFNPYLALVRIFKKLGIEVAIIVHDLIPLESTYPSIIMTKQERILKEATYFIVHNDHSNTGLQSYGIPIYQFRFPLLSPYGLKYQQKKDDKKPITFLFLGHLRKEKGIEILINAWFKLESTYENIELIIAGTGPASYDKKISNLKSIKRINKYISDADYFDLIQNCDYGILPYTGGTNSGILSTFTALSKPVITSDILLFKESKLTPNELVFNSGSSDSLFDLLEKIILGKYDQNRLINDVDIIRNSYKDKFKAELNEFLKKFN